MTTRRYQLDVDPLTCLNGDIELLLPPRHDDWLLLGSVTPWFYHCLRNSSIRSLLDCPSLVDDACLLFCRSVLHAYPQQLATCLKHGLWMRTASCSGSDNDVDKPNGSVMIWGSAWLRSITTIIEVGIIRNPWFHGLPHKMPRDAAGASLAKCEMGYQSRGYSAAQSSVGG
ncbi:hypothetical protein BO85DRAFT_266758 [Aspergillus piperis CBS 112811]|uniref:Uncharacterized protein n=1 Tax=Aspergillus piperis CBS 112811 TaxID=1448313 RepID=A0A8G1R679_9EURO|nr:hypothetical protein BO85DRAFT_266758 [Aspergillus piperis CBS 112811]RAH59247.1 hypothetical protein BO85DRAFT_266758 [Aspergillus piperis CBS 112811]